MDRAVLENCLPWAGMLLASLAALWALMRLGGGRLQLGRLWQLHRDEHGSAQTLSFVLTLPTFIMVILFILQVSQVMIGITVVHYAAFATTRAAIVWIPADVVSTAYGTIAEGPNCISSRVWDPTITNEDGPLLSPTEVIVGPREGIVPYRIEPTSPKYEKIASAAKLACMSICPSRDLGLPLDEQGRTMLGVLGRAYHSMAPAVSGAVPGTDRRLANKMAYACAKQTPFAMWMFDQTQQVKTWQTLTSDHTAIELHALHQGGEVPLDSYVSDDQQIHAVPFQPNEVGWGDMIRVRVTHFMALLPGPGYLLFKYLQPTGRDGTGNDFGYFMTAGGRQFVFRLRAECTLLNEGQKSVHPYVYQLH
jgi:hypothetical protein